jgi:hypothetical protein
MESARLAAASSFLALALPFGCGGRFQPATAPGSGAGPDRPDAPAPPGSTSGAAAFDGVASLAPRPDGFDLAWEPIADPQSGAPSLDFAYAIFATFDGSFPDFAGAPIETTGPGESGSTLTGFSSGAKVRVAVRAVPLADPDATPDLNEVVLSGELLPILYVDRSGDGSGDGSAPDRPLVAINDAVVTALTSGRGANVFVAEGRYVEEVALLGGVHLHGGFPPGFAGPRDAALHRTTIAPAAGGAVGLRLFPNGGSTIGDGLDFDGSSSVAIGVAGSGGFVPTLQSVGDPARPGAPAFSLRIGDALGGSLSFLLLGSASTNLALKGFTLWVDPAGSLFLLLGLPLEGPAGVAGAGSLTLTGAIPDEPALDGLHLYGQALVLDPGAPRRVAASDGLDITFCR